jgi:anaerobic selenocysteine-containing dehydrogenase
VSLSRREFLKLGLAVGSSAALAGCARPAEQLLVSQFDMPELRLPGVPVYYATGCGECRGGCGLAVKTVSGRAIHLMGQPTHPISRGKVCAQSFTALQALYHPDRLKTPLRRSEGGAFDRVDWGTALAALADQLKAGKPALWITGRLGGSRGALLMELARKAGARLWVLEFPGATAERMAMQSLVGRPELPYDVFEDAEYVVNFGGDPLGWSHSPVRYGWSWGQFRSFSGPAFKARGTIVTFSSRMGLTAASSDRWVPVRPGGEGWAALGLALALQKAGNRAAGGAAARGLTLEQASQASGVPEEIFHRLAARLGRVPRGRARVIGGFESAAQVGGLASLQVIYSLNQALGAEVRTFEPDLVLPVGAPVAGREVLISGQEAAAGLAAGTFSNVWIIEVNAAYLLPARMQLAQALKKAANVVRFGPFLDETTALASWVIPTSIWLEDWGDQLVGLPEGAVYNVQQPVVQPTVGPGNLTELLLLAAQAAGYSEFAHKTARELVARFTPQKPEWNQFVARGGSWDEVPLDWEPYRHHNRPLAPPPPVSDPGRRPAGRSPYEHLRGPAAAPLAPPPRAGEQKILIPFPSNSLGDGSGANRPWLPELPDPLTTTVWTTWLEINDRQAAEMHLERGDLVRVTSASGELVVPALPTPSIHPDAVAMPLGGGRAAYGKYGANPMEIADLSWQEGTGELAWMGTPVTLSPTGEKRRLTLMDVRVNKLHRSALPH